jgi:hypothetical protein
MAGQVGGVDKRYHMRTQKEGFDVVAPKTVTAIFILMFSWKLSLQYLMLN